MSALAKSLLTPKEYLEQERSAEFRSEYLSGEMFAMAGATEAHALVVTNLVIQLGTHLRHQPCKTYSHDMRVQTSLSGLYAYPDVVVVCGEAQFRDTRRDTLLNPTFIVEVLSKSTEAYDRGEKFAHYWRLPSLSDYLLISQEKPRVEHFVRAPDNRWLVSEAVGLEARLHIASLECRLLLADVYDKVEFDPPPLLD